MPPELYAPEPRPSVSPAAAKDDAGLVEIIERRFLWGDNQAKRIEQRCLDAGGTETSCAVKTERPEQ